MKFKAITLLLFASLCPAQQSVSLARIDSLFVPPVDSALTHALLYSPLLHNTQQRLDKAEHYTDKWGFVASVIPSPSYSFSDLDRGWRLTFSVNSLISGWQAFAKSRAKIGDYNSDLDTRKESLVYTLIKAYADFEKSRLELAQSRSALQFEESKYGIIHALFVSGKASDIEMINAETALRQAEHAAALRLCESRSICLNIYRISGYRLKQSPLLP